MYIKDYSNKPVKDLKGLHACELQLKEALNDTIKHYQEGLITCEEASRLIYQGYSNYLKAYVKCF